MAFEFQIYDQQTLLPVAEVWVRNILQTTLEIESVAEADLTVLLVDDPAIQRLNRKHLQHDYATDVLSFGLEHQPLTSASDTGLRAEGCRIAGEIVVSTEMAQRMAREYDWPVAAELALYLVHGLLHLCGYDDLTPDERRLMRQREQAVLAPWGWTPRFARDLELDTAEANSAASTTTNSTVTGGGT